jgi:trans-aconitate methyltransferase
LSVTGEQKDYFAHRRARHFAECLRWLNVTPAHVFDYGCGTGSSSVILAEALQCPSLLGVDPSHHSISEARSRNGLTSVRFLTMNEYCPVQKMDAAYCNGVFHHIPPADRIEALRFVYDSLRPGGVLAFWENNPWNPGTKYVMSKCAFDEDAITITSREARNLLRAAGFDVLQTDFLFFFPRQLRWLRCLESMLEKVALGGQYQVLCRKPAA